MRTTQTRHQLWSIASVLCFAFTLPASSFYTSKILTSCTLNWELPHRYAVPLPLSARGTPGNPEVLVASTMIKLCIAGYHTCTGEASTMINRLLPTTRIHTTLTFCSVACVLRMYNALVTELLRSLPKYYTLHTYLLYQSTILWDHPLLTTTNSLYSLNTSRGLLSSPNSGE
jgi:hypothetical protein